MEFDNIETIKRAIEIDAGVALLPEPTVLREVAAGTLVAVPLATDELVRPLGIIHRRGKELSTTTRRFIELLQREGQDIARRPSRRPSRRRRDHAASNGNGDNGTAAMRLDRSGRRRQQSSDGRIGAWPAYAPADWQRAMRTRTERVRRQGN